MPAAVQSATGTVHTGQSKSFFGVGESTRAEGGTPKGPSPSRFLLSGRQKRYVLSVDFAHLSLSIKIIALATICNIMKY